MDKNEIQKLLKLENIISSENYDKFPHYFKKMPSRELGGRDSNLIKVKKYNTEQYVSCVFYKPISKI
ncbi:MAG: hypothetical protein AB7S50_15610 [Bacteroidales bacterium]